MRLNSNNSGPKDQRPLEEQTTLRMTRSQLAELESQLAIYNNSIPQHTQARRRFSRHAYTKPPISIVMEQPGGSPTKLLYTPRDLSASGMGLLHSAYIHTGSRCLVDLRNLGGGIDTLYATVIGCHHITGSVHHVGLRFDHEIEVCDYIVLPGSGPSTYESVNAKELTGSVLFVDDLAADRRMFERILEKSNLTVVTAETADEAMEKLSTPYRVIVLDYYIKDVDAVDLIAKMRDKGVASPIIVTSADDSGQVRSAVHAAGAATFLPKPFQPAKLINAIAEFTLGGPHGVDDAGGDSTTCRLPADDPLRDLVPEYLEELRGLAGRIEEAADDARTLVRICLQIAGSAPSMGYPSIARLANSARAMLNVEGSEDGEQIVTQLVAACKRARVD